MARDYSDNFYKTVNSTEASEFPLILLEISHADLDTPIRVVNDMQDVTHDGDIFTAIAFRVTLPDDKSQGTPKASLSIDNIGKELVAWLELADGGKGATVRMMQILRSDPDVVEFEITMNLSNVKMTPIEISGDLSYEDLLNRPGTAVQYRPSNSPGLF
jgi:hypothetical protein